MTPPPAHSPLPWKLISDGHSTHIGTDDHYVALVCEASMGFSTQNKADAEFIIKAVNLHDKLVEALEAQHEVVAKTEVIDADWHRKKCAVCALLREARGKHDNH